VLGEKLIKVGIISQLREVTSLVYSLYSLYYWEVDWSSMDSLAKMSSLGHLYMKIPI
jgi:hypothetical protein